MESWRCHTLDAISSRSPPLPFFRRCSRLYLRDARTSQDVPVADERKRGKAAARYRMNGTGGGRKKAGDDENENERWMLTRDRSGHVPRHPLYPPSPSSPSPPRFSSIPLLRHFPPSPRSPTIRTSRYPFCSSPRYFSCLRCVFSHVTRPFGCFSHHLLSRTTAPIAHGFSPSDTSLGDLELVNVPRIASG